MLWMDTLRVFLSREVFLPYKTVGALVVVLVVGFFVGRPPWLILPWGDVKRE